MQGLQKSAPRSPSGAGTHAVLAENDGQQTCLWLDRCDIISMRYTNFCAACMWRRALAVLSRHLKWETLCSHKQMLSLRLPNPRCTTLVAPERCCPPVPPQSQP